MFDKTWLDENKSQTELSTTTNRPICVVHTSQNTAHEDITQATGTIREIWNNIKNSDKNPHCQQSISEF